MVIIERLHHSPFWLRVLVTFGFLVALVIVLEAAPWPGRSLARFYATLGFPHSEALFLGKFTIAFVEGFGLLFTLWVVILLEQPLNWRVFLLLDRPDWNGFWILAAARGVIAALEVAFVYRLVWTPIQNWLISLGLWTEPMFPTPPRAYLALNVFVLIVISWVEMVEELYFRGYLQHQITKRLGAFWGIVLSLLLWDLWHIWNPAMFVRRFFITLPDAIIVYRRGRVWAPMLIHPLGNRLLVLSYLLLS